MTRRHPQRADRRSALRRYEAARLPPDADGRERRQAMAARAQGGEPRHAAARSLARPDARAVRRLRSRARRVDDQQPDEATTGPDLGVCKDVETWDQRGQLVPHAIGAGVLSSTVADAMRLALSMTIVREPRMCEPSTMAAAIQLGPVRANHHRRCGSRCCARRAASIHSNGSRWSPCHARRPTWTLDDTNARPSAFFADALSRRRNAMPTAGPLFWLRGSACPPTRSVSETLPSRNISTAATTMCGSSTIAAATNWKSH